MRKCNCYCFFWRYRFSGPFFLFAATFFFFFLFAFWCEGLNHVVKFDVDIIMNRHTVCHVSKTCLVWIHVMNTLNCACFIINNRFPVVYFISFFSTQIKTGNVSKCVGFFIFFFLKNDGIVFFENLTYAVQHEFIVGVDLVRYQEIGVVVK